MEQSLQIKFEFPQIKKTGRPIVHGYRRRSMQRTREYHSWASMVQRCTNPRSKKFKDYGLRGIKICSRWLGPHGFEHFLEDMGERPLGKTLDRIWNDGDYGPNNCRWATYIEQNNNRRPRKRRLAA